MNRARLASAALVVGSVMFAGAVMTAQVTQAPPMTSVLAGKKFTPPVRGEALVEIVQPVTKAQPGKNIATDGSSQLVHALLAHDLVDELHLLVYPLTLGSGKRVLPNGVHATFTLRSATPYPTGVVGLHYVRQQASGTHG